MVVLLLLLGAAGFGLWRSGSNAEASAAAAQPGRMVSIVPAPRPGLQAPAPVPAARPAQPRMVPLVDMPRRRALEKELFSGSDVLGFVRAHLAEARAGDSEAQFVIGFALMLCRNMQQATMPDGRPARDALGDVTATEEQRRIAQNIADRCDALDQARGEVGTAQDWLRQADRSGVGAAMLMEAESAEFGSDQARIDKLRQAMATGDPSVVRTLVFNSDRWDRARDSLETADPGAGHVLAAEALTECALGYDCSSGGAAYQLWCARGRCQHADSVQRYYELSMKPQEFAAVQDYATTLAANIRSGGDNWPEAQKLEQVILTQQTPDSP